MCVYILCPFLQTRKTVSAVTFEYINKKKFVVIVVKCESHLTTYGSSKFRILGEREV